MARFPTLYTLQYPHAGRTNFSPCRHSRIELYKEACSTLMRVEPISAAASTKPRCMIWSSCSTLMRVEPISAPLSSSAWSCPEILQYPHAGRTNFSTTVEPVRSTCTPSCSTLMRVEPISALGHRLQHGEAVGPCSTLMRVEPISAVLADTETAGQLDLQYPHAGRTNFSYTNTLVICQLDKLAVPSCGSNQFQRGKSRQRLV